MPLNIVDVVMYPPNKRFEPLCSSVNTNCTEQWTHRVTDRDNLVFGSDRTPNTSSEPLFSCTDTNCTGHTDRQNIKHLPVASLFLKGLPPKQPEGFGCFVCPNFEFLLGPINVKKSDKCYTEHVTEFRYIKIIRGRFIASLCIVRGIQ